MRKKSNCPDTTTLLPKAFIENDLDTFGEENSKEDNQRYKFRFNKQILQRKQRRKEKRVLKKQKKSEYYNKSKRESLLDGKTKNEPVKPGQKETLIKVAESDANPESAATNRKVRESPTKPISKPKLESTLKSKRLKDDIDLDYDYYSRLLKIPKTLKKLPSAFEKEGLGEFFEGLHSSDDSSSERDSVDSAFSDDESVGNSFNFSEEGSDYGDSQSSKEDAQSSSEMDSIKAELLPNKSSELEPVDKSREIFGQSDKRYIPPHQRVQGPDDEKVTRSVKGLVNKLTLDNLHPISDLISAVYAENPRKLVTDVLTKTIVDVLNDRDHLQLNERMIAGYAALIGILVGSVGMELAAHFVQGLVERLIELRYRNFDAELDRKLAENAAVMLAAMYQFEIVGSELVYDIINELLDRMSEMDISLLLSILKISGPKLRKDNPRALNEIIQLVNESKSSKSASELPPDSRAAFMVATLADLANNRVSKRLLSPVFNSDDGLKLTKMIVKAHSGTLSEPLRVTLEDVQSVDTRGKWWLVGSSWAGVEQSRETSEAAETDKRPSRLDLLAKKSGMNTAVRKQIFTVLMTSSDFADATQALLKLNLTKKQSREIIWVAVQCCALEKRYNPYYSFVIELLAKKDYGHVVTLRFILWDLLKELETSRDHQEKRWRFIARLYSSLIQRQVLLLSVLKVVQFLSLSDNGLLFLRNMICDIFFQTYMDELRASKTASANSTIAPSSLVDTHKEAAAQFSEFSPIKQIFIKATDAQDKLTSLSLRDGLMFFMYSNILADEVFETVKQQTEFSTYYYPLFNQFSEKSDNELLKEILLKQSSQAKAALETIVTFSKSGQDEVNLNDKFESNDFDM